MIITTRAVPQGRNNDKDWPAFYECNFLEPGMVNYADAGAGLAYLSKESILKMLPTFMGKPVIDEQHIDVSPGTYKKHAVGYITKVWFDDVANWAKCQFILTDDKAKANVAMGYSVSCAYDNVVTGPGGERNAVRYDEEILDGFGNHLALVTQPRYESCRIQPCMMLVNAKKAVITEGEGKLNAVDDGDYSMYIKRWIDAGRDPKEGLKTRFGLTKSEADIVMDKYEKGKKNTVTVKVANAKNYCGNCGEPVQAKDIHDGQFVCPKCHWDSWESELIPARDFRKTKWPMQELLAMTPEQKKKVREGYSPGDVSNAVTVKVNAITRICDSCDYLVQGKCEVAGPGGKISQRYADARVLGQIQECSAYEEAGERRIKENLVTVKTVNK